MKQSNRLGRSMSLARAVESRMLVKLKQTFGIQEFESSSRPGTARSRQLKNRID